MSVARRIVVAWIVAGAVFVGGWMIRSASAATQGVLYHGVNQTLLQGCLAKGVNCTDRVPGLAQCMRARQQCNAQARASTLAGGLATSVRPRTQLLTRAQALKMAGAQAGYVISDTATLTTYGVLRREDPALAASGTINGSRPVWLIILKFSKPVFVPVPVPSGAPRLYAIEEHMIIDAATGQMTDLSVVGPPMSGRTG